MQYRQPGNPRRQKIIRGSHGVAPPSNGPAIKNIKDLRNRLQEAIALELFTIPPYLCALYSLKGGNLGTNKETYQIILSVAMEEMLHMILAANLLNAINGEPIVCGKKSLPLYPRKMPHSAIGFEVHLLKFSKQSVNTFLQIERPAERTDADDTKNPYTGEFWSIGDFYSAVRECMNRLDREAKQQHKKQGIFTGQKHLQVTHNYYGGGGKLIAVEGIEDANRAIEEIVGQGEGIDGTIHDGGDDAMFGDEVELAHYFRFNEIFCQRRYQPGDRPSASPSGDSLFVDWNSVYNMVPNPKMDMFTARPGVHEKAKAFNWVYSKLLQNIQVACTGKPEVLMDGIPLMHSLRNQAIELMNEESGIGDFAAGPSFEFIA